MDAITPESAAACYEAMLSTAAVEITMIGPSAGEAVTGIFRGGLPEGTGEPEPSAH